MPLVPGPTDTTASPLAAEAGRQSRDCEHPEQRSPGTLHSANNQRRGWLTGNKATFLHAWLHLGSCLVCRAKTARRMRACGASSPPATLPQLLFVSRRREAPKIAINRKQTRRAEHVSPLYKNKTRSDTRFYLPAFATIPTTAISETIALKLLSSKR